MTKRIRAEQFLEPFVTVEVELTTLEGEVLVRELSATERLEISTIASRGQATDNLKAGEVDEGLVMEQLGRLYPVVIAMGMIEPKMTEAQVRRIPSKHTDDMMKIATKIMEISGLTDDEEEAPESVGPDDPKA